MPYSWNICTPTPSLAESALSCRASRATCWIATKGAGDAGDAQRHQIKRPPKAAVSSPAAPPIRPPIFETACPIPAPDLLEAAARRKQLVSAASDAITPAPSRQAAAEALDGASQRKFQAANFTHQTFDRKMAAERMSGSVSVLDLSVFFFQFWNTAAMPWKICFSCPGVFRGEGSSW